MKEIVISSDSKKHTELHYWIRQRPIAEQKGHATYCNLLLSEHTAVQLSRCLLGEVAFVATEKALNTRGSIPS